VLMSKSSQVQENEMSVTQFITLFVATICAFNYTSECCCQYCSSQWEAYTSSTFGGRSALLMACGAMSICLRYCVTSLPSSTPFDFRLSISAERGLLMVTNIHLAQ
jgi:hypothetical protein